MKTNFTPAPWYAGCFTKGLDSKCQCRFITNGSYCGSIATVSVWNGIEGMENGDNDSPKNDEAIANAKLIACAPELFDMLFSLMCRYSSECRTQDLKLVESVHALLLKASE